MTGEIVSFRKRFIGGFNRDDVAAYIAKITKERNDSLNAKEKAERELLVLRGETDRAKAKTDEETEALLSEYKTAKENAESEARRLLLQNNEMQMNLDEMQARITELQQNRVFEPAPESEPTPEIAPEPESNVEANDKNEDCDDYEETEIPENQKELAAPPKSNKLIIKMNRKV